MDKLKAELHKLKNGNNVTIDVGNLISALEVSVSALEHITKGKGRSGTPHHEARHAEEALDKITKLVVGET